ncbi:hypothetical protein MUP46_01085 [Patescibacteria group bacterium]|nr:hypothetical protein [Patescibacteria group bacterium]
MNYCSSVCHKIPNDPLNPKYFCKAWQGEGSGMVVCPKSGEFKAEDCEFLVKPIQRFIPWLHGEVKTDVKTDTAKPDKPKKTTTAKRRTADKN